MVLVKVAAKPATRAEILSITDIFRAKVVDVSSKSYTIEVTGDEEKIRAFLELLKPMGIKEVARTGSVASHGSGDFSIFDGYSVWFSNVGQTDVTVSLFVNTGFTGPSGVPSSDWTNDTFWQSNWQAISPGESLVLRLDFDHARPFNISDNKDPHTHGTDGQWAAINTYDRTEISAIGFEILGNGQATILVGPSTIPEPSTLLLFSLCAAMISRKLRSK